MSSGVGGYFKFGVADKIRAGHWGILSQVNFRGEGNATFAGSNWRTYTAKNLHPKARPGTLDAAKWFLQNAYLFNSSGKSQASAG
jgi:hypothetical protein